MTDLFNALGDSIGGFFNDPSIQLVIRAIGFYVVVVWLAAAYWAYRDLQTRTSNPIAPYLAAALIILFTPILFPFGIVLYRILRPSETVAEANERALAEEAMLVEVESQPHCANCARRVHSDWIICPTCRNRLRRVCPNCSRLVELDWSLCAWCGKDFERPEVLREVLAPAPRPGLAAGEGRSSGGQDYRPNAEPAPAGLAVAESTRASSSVSRPFDLTDTTITPTARAGAESNGDGPGRAALSGGTTELLRPEGAPTARSHRRR